VRRAGKHARSGQDSEKTRSIVFYDDSSFVQVDLLSQAHAAKLCGVACGSQTRAKVQIEKLAPLDSARSTCSLAVQRSLLRTAEAGFGHERSVFLPSRKNSQRPTAVERSARVIREALGSLGRSMTGTTLATGPTTKMPRGGRSFPWTRPRIPSRAPARFARQTPNEVEARPPPSPATAADGLQREAPSPDTNGVRSTG
jgi:hypothetical protein